MQAATFPRPTAVPTTYSVPKARPEVALSKPASPPATTTPNPTPIPIIATLDAPTVTMQFEESIAYATWWKTAKPTASTYLVPAVEPEVASKPANPPATTTPNPTPIPIIATLDTPTVTMQFEESIAYATSSTLGDGLNFQTMSAADMVAQLISLDESLEVRNAAGSFHLDKCAAQFTNGHALGNLVEKYEDVNGNWVARKQLDANGIPLLDANGDYVYFHTSTPIVPETGIILSSGSPNDFNLNDADDTTTSFSGTGGDSDLKGTVDASNGLDNVLFDACILQFEFRCTNNAFVPQISFNYIWGSEEYYEYVNSAFNDVFGFYLNGVNIATLPQTETSSDVVSINNVNFSTNGNYFNGNDPGTGWEEPTMLNAPNSEVPYPQIEADGFTDTLMAYGVPYEDAGEWNIIKLAVADVGDKILDSWVLLEGASFTCLDITEAPSVSSVPTESKFYACLVAVG